MSTLKDVAKRAGVSAQTVSNVVNKRDVVHPETRERILQALEALNYYPNAAARGLRHNRSQTIGFLVIDPSPRYLADPFHSEVVTGMADVARKHDYGLLIQNVSPHELNEFKRLLQPFQQGRIDGAVVTLGGPTALRQQYLDQLKQIRQPFVLLEQKIKAPNAACVLGENRRGAFEATQFLLHKGLTRIAYLASTLAWPAVEARISGYRDALQAHQIKYEPDLLTYCASETPEAAYEATVRLLTDQPEVTAILGANDLLAVGALQAAQDLGRSVPEKLAIIGFDDFNFAQYVRPKLTTVRLPGYEMGYQAAHLLLEYFRTGSFLTSELNLPVRLIMRDSA